MNLDRYLDQFLALKDDFIRDARMHQVNADNLLDWVRAHTPEAEWSEESDLGFASKEEEYAWMRNALHQFRASESVMGYVKALRRIGADLTPKDRRAFVHAIGDAIKPDAMDAGDRIHAFDLKIAMKEY